MKKCLLLFLLLPLFALSQKNKVSPFFSIKGGLFKFNDVQVSPAGYMSFGVRTKEIGIGLGAGIMGIEKDTYVPLFVEGHACYQRLKVSPYAAFRIGTGIFNSEHYGTTTKGGLYVGGDLGVYFPVGQHGIIIAANMNSSKFSQQFTVVPDRTFSTLGYGGFIGFRF